MKKKILLIAMLSSMSVSIYPVSVFVRNNTDQPVWAQINNQKRRTLSPAEVATLFSSTAERGKYPDFFPIGPHDSRSLATAVRKKLRKVGVGGVASIKKVRFVRVKGYKKVTDTFKNLRDRIDTLAKKYANIGIFRRLRVTGWLVFYVNYFKQRREGIALGKEPIKSAKITIELPQLEEFTYDLKDNPIRGFKKHVIELESWGKAVRTK